MEADTANRYRSRILREMNANRDNPFNSPPSSTGSHGTVSPTLSSVFSDPDGESTRRLNEDIARVTAPRKLPVNLEAAHRKWPEFYGMPKSRSVPIFEDNTDTRPMSPESKENRPPGAAAKHTDDSTQDPWQGSGRTRSEMQPRVDNDSDASILHKSPGRGLSVPGLSAHTRQPSPLAMTQTHGQSAYVSHDKARSSLTDALNELRRSSKSPKDFVGDSFSPNLSSGKSSLTAVPPSPGSVGSNGHNASHVRSFFMPDISHLGDFVTGTLRFNGAVKNGVPLLVKRGKEYGRQEKSSQATHAEVDGVGIPEDEEKIFVSMDMIREEIISLQEHYDKVQDYAAQLQQQVESLESQLKYKSSTVIRGSSDRTNEQLIEQKNRLEAEVISLQSRLDQASHRNRINDIENDSLTQEKDRAVRKLQEACDDINKLTRKLSAKEKELEASHKQLESSERMRHDNDTLHHDIVSLKHGRDALELENASLRSENQTVKQQTDELQEEAKALRRQQESLISDNRSLRSHNKTLMDENEDLRRNLDGVQQELDDAHRQMASLREEVETLGEDRSTLGDENRSLVRHNEKYFNDNKILRRENSGFERSINDLRDKNLKLKDEVNFLKQQLDHCRPIPKDDFSARLDEETEENMTSAFFIPDITMNTNESGPAENTGTQNMPALPDFTMQSNRLSTIADVTEELTQKSAKNDMTSHSKKQLGHRRTKSGSKVPSKSSISTNPKVAFSIPDPSIHGNKSSSNIANRGSKRQTTSRTGQQNAARRMSFPTNDIITDNEDTTGFLSGDNTTQEMSVPVHEIMRSRKEGKAQEQRNSRSQNVTQTSQRSQRARSQSRSSYKNVPVVDITAEITQTSQKPQRPRSQSRSSYKGAAAIDVTTDSYKTTDKDACPALSNDARRVLDGLCEHNCQNCTVCSRITSHRGVVSSADLVSGKKRVVVPRPVPVTDRDLSTEDPTMRPAHSPGHALAMVIKGLEDEAQHLQLELTRLQFKYSSSDKALGRRERLTMAEGIRTLLKTLEAKNDQIYSLYDVLEGQKAAGQAMSEEEIEMTVLNITGMTVRDVTGASEQLTWDGIPDL